jgi:predicted permease
MSLFPYQMSYQLKQANSSLNKKPGFIALVSATIGLTLGALLCVLTLGYVLLYKPLPYPDQERLVVVEHPFIDRSLTDDPGKTMFKAFTYPSLMALQDEQTVFSQTALASPKQGVLTNHSALPTVEATYVTPGWFTLLNIPMKLGRSFAPSESKNSYNPVAVISHKSWQNEFAATPDILDRKIEFGGVSFSIVGVTAPDFVEPQVYRVRRQTQLWLPWDFNPVGEEDRKNWGRIFGGHMVGKLAIGVTPSQAEQSITPIVNSKWQAAMAGNPSNAGRSIGLELQSFESKILGDSAQVIYLLLASVFGLIVIAITNIANLFMSRTAQKQRALSIQAALGAKKRHLFQALLAESTLLMFYSLLLALVVASVGFWLLQQHLHALLPRIEEVSLNAFTLGTAFVISSLIALLLAYLGAASINYKALNTTLQSSGKGTGVQVSKKLRQVLMVCQVAVATVLIFVNISLFKAAIEGINTPMGFDAKNVHSLTLSSASVTLPPAKDALPVIEQIKQALKALPQIASVSHTQSPLDVFGTWMPGLSTVGGNEKIKAEFKVIDEQYFQLIKQQKLAGKFFSAQDVRHKEPVIIVNESFAQLLRLNYARPESVLGEKLVFRGDKAFTIIGVVKGIQVPGKADIMPRVYVTKRPSGPARTRNHLAFTIKTKDNQSLSRQQLVDAIKGVSRQFTANKWVSLEDYRHQLLFTQYTSAITTAALTVLTIILAGIGLYGILSYAVQMRKFELGTRMAVGAKRADLIRLIITDNIGSMLLGVLISILGLGIGLFGLYATSGNELPLNAVQMVMVFSLTFVVISLVCLSACYLPLRGYINRPAMFCLRNGD